MQRPVLQSAPLSDLLAPVAGELARVEDLFRETCESQHPLVREMVHHSQRFSGKRLRPALVVLAGRAAGEWDDEIVPVAVVVEMIHTATLVHDDVLDEALLRRQVSSCNALFGNEGAVLLGDFLFARAFALSASLRNRLASRYLAEITSSPRSVFHASGKVVSGSVGSGELGCRAAAVFCSSGTFACATIFVAAGLNTALPPVWSPW